MTTTRGLRAGRATGGKRRLARGFGSLTLDPSPRLHATREKLSRQDPVQEAWDIVGSAMTQAMRSVGKTIRNPS